MNSLTTELATNISKYIETQLESHLHLDSSKCKSLVSEDTLFDYESQFNILKSKNDKIRQKLTDFNFIKNVKTLLEKIDVKLHLSNTNTILLTNVWLRLNQGQPNLGLFYTNTNLMVEFQNIVPHNGSFVCVHIFTEDKQIDFIYGFLTHDGSFGANYQPLDDKLMECKSKLYHYIHPHIYLDYYMNCASENDMNEVIHSTSIIQMLKSLETDICKKTEDIKYLNKITEFKNKEKIEAENKMRIAIEECHTYFNMTLEYENRVNKLEAKNQELKTENVLFKNDNRQLQEELQRVQRQLETSNHKSKQTITGIILGFGTFIIIFIAYNVKFAF